MPTDTSYIDTSFTLCDEHTVKKLLQDSPELLPNYPEEKAVNRGIDLAYGKEQISASVTSGILQGKSIPDIANDLQNRIETMNRNSAIRVARTACTEAENAGRLDSYIEAQGMGIDLQKQWMATSDSRTRPTHAEADGQIVDIDKPFEVGSDELMFPGDPSGSPAEIYNCRCTMVSVLKEEETPAEIEEEAEPEIEQIEFEPAKTLAEAREYAENVLGLTETTCYEKMGLQFANAINQEITNVYNEFGNLHEEGVLNGLRKLSLKRDAAAAYNHPMKEMYFKSTSNSAIRGFKQTAKIEHEIGSWSTDSEYHAIRHELGHAVEYTLSDDKMKEISDLRESVTEKCDLSTEPGNPRYESSDLLKASKYLSYYGLYSDGEFIAESVAEYMNGSPRETAKAVVDIIKRK